MKVFADLNPEYNPADPYQVHRRKYALFVRDHNNKVRMLRGESSSRLDRAEQKALMFNRFLDQVLDGYAISKPIPIAELERLLEKNT